MINKKKSILFISSADPLKGPGKIALDYVEAFRQQGYDVDFLTKYKVENCPDIKYVLNKKESKLSNLGFKLWRKIIKPKTEGHFIFYRKEKKPPVNIKKVLKKITKDYDIIIVFFWQNLLSYKTLESIYDKMTKKPQVIFLCADYSPMTGGCHFIGDCDNYKTGCGKCPMLKGHSSANDFTAKNVRERIRINSKIHPIVSTNLYMQSFFKKSPVMNSGAKLILNSIILDLDKFKELDKLECRKELDINSNGDFVIFFGAQSISDKRKGMRYLLDALGILYSLLSEKERNSIIILTAGSNSESLRSQIPFKQKHLGYVDMDKLPIVYSAADVFVSPSVNDAGPSMVNQAIACGTPVVAFEIGTAIEVIKNTGAGFCATLFNSKELADGILSIFRQTEDEKRNMRRICRETAIQHHSYKNVVNKFEKYLR